MTVTLSWAGILSPVDIDGAKQNDEIPLCNIYLIARRPRVFVDPGHFVCSDEVLSLRYLSDWGDGDPASIVIEGPNPWGQIVRLRTDPPHSELSFVVDNDEGEPEILLSTSAAVFLAAYLAGGNMKQRMDDPTVDGNLLDLDVVYVGQSLDEGGVLGRRLANHSTLQRILADTQKRSPHLEVWVVIMQFIGYNTMGALGPWSISVNEADSFAHLENVHTTKLGLGEVTALVEAALIRYFQPAYNKTFKYHFPKMLHTSYQSVYQLDFNSVGFEFETYDPIGVRLKSDFVEPNFVHTALFSLEPGDERRRFFDFWEGVDAGSPFYVDRPDSPNDASNGAKDD